MYKYIISGDGMMALAVHTNLLYLDFERYVKQQSQKLHPKGTDTYFRYGVFQFINPVVWPVNDFANHLPALIEVKQ